jgi:hypothetical protein
MMGIHLQPWRAEPVRVTTSQVVPIAGTIGGYTEELALAGNLRLGFQVTVDTRGVTHIEIEVRPLEVTAAGVASGTRYHVLVTPASRFDGAGPPPLDFTFVFSLRLMGRGPENDLLVYDTVHITVSGDCSVIATPKDSFSVLCRRADPDSSRAPASGS